MESNLVSVDELLPNQLYYIKVLYDKDGRSLEDPLDLYGTFKRSKVSFGRDDDINNISVIFDIKGKEQEINPNNIFYLQNQMSKQQLSQIQRNVVMPSVRQENFTKLDDLLIKNNKKMIEEGKKPLPPLPQEIMDHTIGYGGKRRKSKRKKSNKSKRKRSNKSKRKRHKI